MVVGSQAAIAVTFAWSALSKVVGPAAHRDFRHWVGTATGVPTRFAAPVAALVVALEAAIAAAVLVPALAAVAFAAAVLLLAAFTVGTHRMIRRRVTIPCRCFGAGTRPPGPIHLVRNGLLMAVAAAGFASWPAAATPPLPALVLAAAIGASVALVCVNLDEIVIMEGDRGVRSGGGDAGAVGAGQHGVDDPGAA